MGSSRRRTRAAAVLAALIAATAACSGPTGSGTDNVRATDNVSATDSSPAPVIFVHGFGLTGASWSGAMGQFQAQGYAASRLSAITYQPAPAIETSAKVLEQEVDKVLAATGASKVDIVSHSQGSMVAKTCIILGRCKGRTAHWESIAGVDNGANELDAARGMPSNEDVQGRTPLRKLLQDGWQEGIVAQGVKVQVHWSPNDGIVPDGLSQQPPPAVNIPKPALNHVALFLDTAVLGETITFLAT
jgi:triacylglycerol lipase